MSLLLRPAACFARAARGAARAARLASTTVVEGAEGTESYRQFFEEGGKRISPWHDIPLEAGGGAYNMVTEIPKYGLAKMEVDTKGESNPIMQDTKKGKLRFYHGPIFWNYGFLPQTWEDPARELLPGLKGDGDPVDCVKPSPAAHRSRGSTYLKEVSGNFARAEFPTSASACVRPCAVA